MAYFDDFAAAVAAYPSLSVTLSIVDVVVHVGTPGTVNVNEMWMFQVRVTNRGHLNMTNVALIIEGLNGARVNTVPSGTFDSRILPPALPAVNAHSSVDTVSFYFKAPGTAKRAGTALVKAHILNFDADLRDILISHSRNSDPPAANYVAQVFA